MRPISYGSLNLPIAKAPRGTLPPPWAWRTCYSVQDKFDGEFPLRYIRHGAGRIHSIQNGKVSAQEPTNIEVNSNLAVRWWMAEPEINQA
jgi:hypothetical protein